MVVLTTGHTTTTGMLTVLSDTTVTGGHMTAARKKRNMSVPVFILAIMFVIPTETCREFPRFPLLAILSDQFEKGKRKIGSWRLTASLS
jgi:hypothetical protein